MEMDGTWLGSCHFGTSDTEISNSITTEFIKTFLTNKHKQTSFTEQSSSCEENHSASQETPTFMEPEVSLPCSQQPATGPYPELDASSPHLLTLFS
jgi:hypothetical protein